MINFNTKLDLERQSKILSGHTAVFDGGVSFGIPFSGFPSGVDTGTTVLTSYNVITGETSGYSGTTGTTFFGITPVNPSAFTDSRIITGTTGLTSVITGVTTNYIQTYGPIWDLTSSTIIDEHLVGLSYSGYLITYTFNNVSASTPTTFDAYVNARVDYYSANTLDYKGSTNWLTIRGNATVDERLIVNRLTVTSGATVGYVLTCSDSGGTVEWQSGSSVTSLWVEDGVGNTAIKDIHGTHSITGTSDNSIIAGGYINSIYNSINSGIFAGSGNTITGHTNAFIGGGSNNLIDFCSSASKGNTNESIIGGNSNEIKSAKNSTIIGGGGNILNNITYGGQSSIILGGTGNTMTNGNTSTIIGGSGNTLGDNSCVLSYSTIIGGYGNNIASVNTGGYNMIANSITSSIDGQYALILNSNTSNIIGNSYNSTIIGGSGNTITSAVRSVILGGQNISATLDDYVYTPNMIINTGGTTSKLGINTTPSHVIHAVGNKSNFYLEDSYTSGIFDGARQMIFYGDTDTAPQYVLTDGVVDIAIGVRGTTTSNTTYMQNLGIAGDTFIAASSSAKGLNIINVTGSGTEDFIRLYAGQYPDDVTQADIHIQGSGTTRGYVGIGTETPTEKLDVSGNVIISGSLTKGSGTFRIPNPTPNKDNYLYHSFVESPNAGDNIYRWSIEITNGIGLIELPDYYNHLNENNQIWVNPVEHFGIGYGKIIENTLEIHCNVDGNYNVLLIGTRKDEIAITNWKGVERNN